MKQKEKDLLLKDLCARMPYGVICRITDTNDEDFQRDGKLTEIRDLDTDANGTTFVFFNEHVPCYSDITEIKPYLRPMDSMTEDELAEFVWLDNKVAEMPTFEYVAIGNYRIFDWLNRKHFDYRGLIEKGLAIEATSDMYKED